MYKGMSTVYGFDLQLEIKWTIGARISITRHVEERRNINKHLNSTKENGTEVYTTNDTLAEQTTVFSYIYI